MKHRLVNPVIKEDYIRNLLTYRGIKDVDCFLNPNDGCIESPGFFDNMPAGQRLYIENIGKGKKVLICADCDVDGFTSAAIIWQYTLDIEPETELYFKLHTKKQHGLEDHIVTILNENIHYDLIIMPDASSNDYNYHEDLKKINTPVLVLDHHILETYVSDNAVIINNQSSQNYENKELTGAGVTWQFCRYIDSKTGFNEAEKYTDLAALGIIGDMGGMNEIENQAIVKKGLNSIHNFFFKSLIEKQSFSMGGKINPTTVAFYIVPMINAMIRVGSMEEKTRLFEAFLDGERMVPSNKRGAKGTMEKLAIESARECTNAKSRQDKKKEEIVGRLEAKIFKHDLLENKILFVRLDDDDEFPSELNGLVAMQLAAKFQRPTIVARLNEEGYIRGSARGLNESLLSSFKEYLDKTELFEYTAGHDNAFGISIKNSDLSILHNMANEELKDMNFNETSYDVNFERHAMDADLGELICDIASYDYLYGQKMTEPLIYVDSINIKSSDIQVCGARQDTVRFEKNGIIYIQFHAKQLIEDLKSYPEMQLEVVGRANINEWMGRKTPQIMIKSYEIKNGDLAF